MAAKEDTNGTINLGSQIVFLDLRDSSDNYKHFNVYPGNWKITLNKKYISLDCVDAEKYVERSIITPVEDTEMFTFIDAEYLNAKDEEKGGR